MAERPEQHIFPDPLPASTWVQRWSHLIAPGLSVLDLACGQGRHMKWFARRGHAVTGVDRSVEALASASRFGQVLLADLENGPWPLQDVDHAQQFGAVVVTNYLWRPLFPLIAASLAPGGLLIYETFSAGNETVGKPSRSDFLLQPAELLHAFASLRIVAFEEGFLDQPARFLQRIAAVKPDSSNPGMQSPRRLTL
ncbi:MAG: class I SAM-dependent methyltransferase [Comamonadaceae bacterium]